MNKKLIFTLAIALLLTGSLMAQDNTPKPTIDKRKNAQCFSDGLQCKYREDVDGAIRNFENALKFMPNDAASMYELSEQYVMADRMEDAFAMIKNAVETEPSNKWYKIRLGKFYRNYEMYDEFIALYGALTEEYPEDMDMLSEYIDVLLVVQDYDKALKEIDLLEQQIGQNELIDEQRVAIYRQVGNNKKLISLLKKIIKKHPFNTRYYSMLARIYLDEGKDKDALKLFEKVKELDPDDPYVHVSLHEYYDNKGDKKKAFEELLESIRNKNLEFQAKSYIYGYWFHHAPESPETGEQAFQCGQAFIEAHPDQPIGYKALLAYYIHGNDMPKTHEMSEMVLSLDSTDYQAWELLIYSDIQLQNVAVYQHAHKAVEYYPMHPLFNFFAGEDCMLNDKTDEAIYYLERSRKYNTEDPALMPLIDGNLGDLYHDKGNDEEAFAAYDRCLAADSSNSMVLNNYAYFLSLRGERLDEALRMAEKATELDPDNKANIDTRAWVLYKLGRYAEAKKWMERCIKEGEEVAGDYLEHYGDILYKLGDKNAALEQWGKAQKAGDYSDKLEQKLKDGVLYE